jgi:hypothetical protein
VGWPPRTASTACRLHVVSLGLSVFETHVSAQALGRRITVVIPCTTAPSGYLSMLSAHPLVFRLMSLFLGNIGRNHNVSLEDGSSSAVVLHSFKAVRLALGDCEHNPHALAHVLQETRAVQSTQLLES